MIIYCWIVLNNILNIISIQNYFFGIINIALFHLFFIYLLLFKKDRKLVFYFLIVTAATDLLEVNFLSTIGASTAISYSNHISVSTLNFFFIDISLLYVYLFLFLLYEFYNVKINKTVLFVILSFLLLIFIGSFVNLIDGNNGFYSDIAKLLLFLSGIFFGINIDRYNLNSILFIRNIIALNFIIISIFSILNFTRIYAGQEVAYTNVLIGFILFLPFLVTKNKYLFYIIILFSLFAFDHLISGKYYILLFISALLIYKNVYKNNFFKLNFLFLSIFITIPYFYDWFSFLNVSSVSIHKFNQMNAFNLIKNLPKEVFFATSVGNILAEFITVINNFFTLKGLFGFGLGGYVKDSLDILKYANLDSYTNYSFSTGNYYGLHLAFLNIIHWFGIFFLISLFFLPRFVFKGPFLLPLIYFMFYGTGNKVDVILFGIFLGFVCYGYKKIL